MKKLVLHITIAITILLLSVSIYAQNMSGEQIKVSSLSLTVLKFNSTITHYEFDDKDNYAGQIRNSDNSFVIRVIGNNASNTNLYLSEGKRGHWFVINFIGDSIDLNKVKLFNDFSDLKYVKKLVEQEQQQQADALAKSGNTIGENNKQSEKKKKQIAENAEKDSIAFAKADEKRLAKLKEERQKQKEIDDAKQAQLAQDSINNIKADQEKIAKAKQAEAERKHQEELTAKAEHDAYIEDSIAQVSKLAKLKAEVARSRHTADSLKAVNIKLAKEKHVADSVSKTEQLARLKEETERNQRVADSLKALNETIAKEKLASENKHKEELAAKAKRNKFITDSIASADKLAKSKEKEAKAAKQKLIQDSLAALPKVYTHVELWRKYPKFVFEQPPSGQSFAVDYLNPNDTLENYTVSTNILRDMVKDDALQKPIVSNTQDGVSFILKSINFSGTNCFMRILINNTNSKNDYLTGPMTTVWQQTQDDKKYNLYACYVTAFPVLSPHAQREIVLVTRAVNIKNEDVITLNIGDRLQRIDLNIVIPGKLYNEQYDIIRSLKEE